MNGESSEKREGQWLTGAPEFEGSAAARVDLRRSKAAAWRRNAVGKQRGNGEEGAGLYSHAIAGSGEHNAREINGIDSRDLGEEQ